MGLETVNDDGTARLHQLNTANPTGTDNKNQGDDHIRNIKKAIKDQFSGISGDSSSGAVTATAAELNKMDGCTATTSNLNALAGINNIYDVVYPVGCIYESTVATDPSTLFPGTNWSSFGQGKMLVGLDPNDADFNSTSDSGGSKTVTLTEDQMPSHDHDDTFATSNAGTHNHNHTLGTSSAGTHKHGTNLRLEGAWNGNVLIDNSLYYNTGVHGREIDELSDTNSGDSTYTMNAGSHNHSITGGISNAGSHSHSITGSVSNAGGGQAHDNMPPYVVVYRWKRDS
jgi:microcystin-dependent protein